jgi:superfamily II DNA or RNA helicase
MINGFDVSKDVQIIAEGAEKKIKGGLLLCTWQSIYKQPAKWFNDSVDVIMGDEIHVFKADCVKGIFEKATSVKYRFGVTGSLDKAAVNKMVLKGLIGDISRVKTTRDLINDGHLSDVRITCIVLKYNSDSKKLLKSADYQTELEFIFNHKKRTEFIKKLALAQKGNTLVLFSRIAHGEELYEQIKASATSQKVHYVSGDVEADDREAIRHLIQNETGDSVTVASVGTMSTGTNIPRIHTIIFAAPTKSVIRVIQSLGRGLRKADGKEYLKLIDIADNIVPSKSKPNHTMIHFVERIKVYVDEEHQYVLKELQIE